MRYWLLTNTTYGTWLPGDRRGSITSVRETRPGELATPSRHEHDTPGEAWEPPLPGLHRAATASLKGPPVLFTLEQANAVLRQFIETASYRSWRLVAVSIMANHFHLAVAVDGDPEPRKMLADFKAYASRTLNQQFGSPPSKTWWTTKGSKRKLPDEQAVEAAINYVLNKQPNPLATWAPDDNGEPGA